MGSGAAGDVQSPSVRRWWARMLAADPPVRPSGGYGAQQATSESARAAMKLREGNTKSGATHKNWEAFYGVAMNDWCVRAPCGASVHHHERSCVPAKARPR